MKRLISGLLAVSFPAFGAEIPVFDGGEVVVTATRTPRKITETLSSITVIGPEQIAAAGQQTLGEVLQAAAGAELRTTGGPGQPATIFLRGSNSNHVLVLVDGIRMDNVTSGATALESIPLEQIERIEVLRGPASSLYGSDAIGGVVQIFTRSGTGTPRVSASAGLGSYNTQSLSAGFGGKSHDTRFNLQAGQNQSDGFSATNPAAGPYGYNPDRDGYRNTHFSAKLARNLTPDDEIGASVFASDSTIHYDAGLGGDDLKKQKLRAYSIHSRNRINPMWTSTVKLGRGEDSYSFANTAWPSSTDSTQDQASWQNDLKLGFGNLSLGAERLNQKVSGTTAYDRTERTVNGLFAAYQGDFGAHGLQASARRDDNSQFGQHDTGSLAYGYRFSPAWRASAGMGTAFKAPSFMDLYYPGFSNPNLKPERARSREVGMQYTAGMHTVDVRYFDSHISDLIVFAGMAPENISKAHIDGVELSYRGELAGLGLRASLTLQQPRDEDTGKRLRGRAAQHASLGVAKGFAGWLVGAEVVASGARFDSTDEAPASRMGGYGLVNLTARHEINREFSLNARWNNVFDREYVLAQGYNTPGSNLFVSLQYQPR